LTTTGSGSDGQLLVVAGGQAKVCVFTVPDLSLRGSLDLGGQLLLLARQVSPTVVLLLGRDGLLRTFDASSLRSIFEYRTPSAPRVAALSPQRRALAHRRQRRQHLGAFSLRRASCWRLSKDTAIRCWRWRPVTS
jgi:hypothetical protein